MKPTNFKHPRDFSDMTQCAAYLKEYFAEHNTLARFEALPASMRKRHDSLDKMIDAYGAAYVLGSLSGTAAVKCALLRRYFAGEFTPFIVAREEAPAHWILHIGNGQHFANSFPQKIWGINSEVGGGGVFLREGRAGDILWFVKSGAGRRIYAVATVVKITQQGPSAAELGWDYEAGVWDTFVYYDDFRNLSACEIITTFKGQSSVTKYRGNSEPSLPDLWADIVKFGKITMDL
jgi:hypothetical protein